jgi:hypothetical protein
VIAIRKATDRGQTKIDWLDSRHTFSFGDYVDPRHHQFRALRVINDDWVKAGAGFGMHPHRDMEIVTYVLSGRLEHRDSLGNGSVIAPGEVQRMSAGTGIWHGEFNPSATEPVHLLQIWMLPAARGLPPSYEQKKFDLDAGAGQLRLVASPDGRAGSVVVHQDVNLYAGRLAAGQRIAHDVPAGRYAWVQVARGEVDLNGQTLQEGDGAALSAETRLDLRAASDAEALLFDLA